MNDEARPKDDEEPAYCNVCGDPLSGSDVFCAGCGNPVHPHGGEESQETDADG